ncbi:MAG: hypothetical protein AAGF53_07575 [Pseudomonadota bacterium]
MAVLIWIGTAVTLCGLALLVMCIVRIARAKRTGLPETELRDALQKIVPMNTGALFLSMFGLMLVVAGIAFS